MKATAVALTDFEQRAALEIYPHIKSSPSVLPQSFDALHRLGIGVDSMNFPKAASRFQSGEVLAGIGARRNGFG